MAIDDVTNACGILRGVHDDSGGTDGFVSIEVSPKLAWDTNGTIEAARSLHERISLPNLLVIAGMIVVFAIALIAPFPREGKGKDGLN